ncbi:MULTISPECIES: cation:proton antiporter [Sphingobacterium]|uniref:Cation:proton antiporter n=1 Tax=Sphingobacterium paramultivorum TaxID=2886510 RepID=A0A7G5DYV4_9SPHI|nr:MULTISPECIES: cation:proton antiporter [Sphingobacterium]MBB1647345.1 transporter [Sphingobacterium sp. UME9]MCS4163135.1 Kef-type K+ transport system membrane component KefB [Sphingobacterium sp. BIGb0116]QMV66929.1 cation:proton antiporter [Sphingobacterium paramultivorum]WSO15766.1 cation:proton antiporter [Sphingobacterium paramultivorum]
MRKYRNTIFYVVLVGTLLGVMYWMIHLGAQLEAPELLRGEKTSQGAWKDFTSTLFHSLQHPLAILLAQIVTIIIAARIMGWICIKIKQPVVIGEMLAGIILGPSLLGLYFPEFSHTLFPVESLSNLQFLSQIGLILFMFIIGMELDLNVLRNKAHDAVVISHASIVIPFTLGISLAYFLYLFHPPTNVEFLSYSLFIGISMSITAFPVLARIIQERGLQKSKLGAMAITCAAADDITAWCILAVVIAIVKAGDFASALYTIGLAVAYVLIMIKIVRPFLMRVGEVKGSKEALSKPVVAIFFIVLLLSAYATEVIGIHALFGAFMAGAIMPEGSRFRTAFIEKIEDVSTLLLLPLFFVYTGLRTQIGLLNDPQLWMITIGIILVAVIGKFAGSTLAARFVGQSWKDSLSIGALMNTRGLMELIVLNIGYDLGVLSAELFSMMVVMALVTTFMTGPSLDLINFLYRPKKSLLQEDLLDKSKFKILLSFAKSNTGISLLYLADALTLKSKKNAEITALHIEPANELHHYEVETQELDSFREIKQVAQQLEQPIQTIFKISSDIDSEIVQTSNERNQDLLLLGVSESIYEGSLLGRFLDFTTRIVNPEKLFHTVTNAESPFMTFDRNQQINAKVNAMVGILIDKEFVKAKRVIVPVVLKNDEFLCEMIKRLIQHSDAQIIVWDLNQVLKTNESFKEKLRQLEQLVPNHLTITERELNSETWQDQDLMLISLPSWNKVVNKKVNWLPFTPSTLLMADRKP